MPTPSLDEFDSIVPDSIVPDSIVPDSIVPDSIVAEIRAAAEEIERTRTLPEAIVGRLAEIGVFRLAAPEAVGGLGADAVTAFDVFERIGAADGSTGWCAMIGGATSLVLGYLAEPVAAEMLADPRFLVAGVAAPAGRARAVPGGYRVTGRWAFASASPLATWLVGGCVIVDDVAVDDVAVDDVAVDDVAVDDVAVNKVGVDENGPVPGAAGPPRVVMAVLPRKALSIHDTWDALGLCGTGSHDMSAEDLFVPEERTFSLARPPATPHGRFPVLAFLSMGIGAVSLGIARAALDEFARLAAAKINPLTRQPLAAKPVVQTAYAEATAQYAAARAFLRGELDRIWRLAVAGRPVEAADRARLRLAISHATTSAATAVGGLYRAAGGTSVYRSSPLQRYLRDVNTATQHALVSADTLELTGAVLLGQDVSLTRL